MTNIEKLIEALEFAAEEEEPWFKWFDTLEDAKKTVSKAAKEIPEEHQIAYIIALAEPEDIFEELPETSYHKVIKRLGKDVRYLRKKS